MNIIVIEHGEKNADVVVVVDSHIQRIVLATEETTVTQGVSVWCMCSSY